jgi:hypothetical protein
MRLAVCAATSAAALMAWSAAAAPGVARTRSVSCSDSVYQTPPNAPPGTIAALRLGPVVFNHLSAHSRKDVLPPTTKVPFYSVASFMNVLTSARHGVTIRLIGGDPADRLSPGLVGPAQRARAIRFALCRDPETKKPLITQYGISFLLRTPGCFTVEVQAVGTSHRYHATIPVRAGHC